MANKIRWAAFGCVHLHRGKVWDRAMSLVREYKPDVLVCLGDVLDADAASRFPQEDPKALSSEYETMNTMLREASEAAPKAQLVFMEGNHELNIRDKLRLPKAVRELCDYRKHVSALDLWDWHPYDCSEKGVFRLGQVAFYHGYETGPAADQMQAIQHCKPFGLGVSAHTHMPREPFQIEPWRGRPIPYWAMNVGTLGSLRPGYMLRKRTNTWGHGVALGSCTMIRSARASRLWHAELVRIEP